MFITNYLNDYHINILILIGIYVILAQAFNLNFGLARLFNLAHVASYSIGAYTSALLSTELEIPFLWCALASVLLSGLFALLIGAISIRLDQDYFAIGSLAFSFVVSALLINWKSVTRGVLGIPGIPRPTIAGVSYQENALFLLVVIACVVIVQLPLWVLFRNRYGRSLVALSEFEHAALALGQNTRKVRTISFVIAAATAGLAGSLFAFYLNYIDPSSFSLTEMIFVLTIVVVGRPGSFWGCIFAAVFLMLVPEALRMIDFSPGILGPMRQLVYAVILFGVVWMNRERLFPPERTI